MKSAGKVFVVTGAGSGMGREVVLELLRRGARVAGVDMNATALEQTAATANAGEQYASFTLSVTDRAAVYALPAQVEAASARSMPSSTVRASFSRSFAWPTSTML